MKIRCPKCQKEIELGVSKFPPMGLEVVCPSCDAKFRMKSKGRSTPISDEPAPASATPIVAPAPAAAPAPADDFDALDDLADLFDEIEQLSAEEPAAPNYYVRSSSGKVFGPLTPDAIKQMIQVGQLAGDEPLSLDQQSWQPMIECEGFADVAVAPPAESEEDEWVEEAAPRPAAAPAPRPSAPPIATIPSAEPSARPTVSAQDIADAAPPAMGLPNEPSVPFQTVNRQAPRRIRSALKDEVLEAGDTSEGLNIKDPKIIGGGVVLLLLLGVVIYLLFSGNSSKSYPKVSMSFQKAYAIDSHILYLKRLLPKINRDLRKYPGHPQLLLHRALVLSMYLEHYRPDRSREAQFKSAFRKVKPPLKGEQPTFHYSWLRAQRAIIRGKAINVLRWSQAMIKKRPNHAGALYLRGKAFAMSGRVAKALKIYESVAQRMSEPARVYFAKGLALTYKKRVARRKRATPPAKRGTKAPPKRGTKPPAKRGTKPPVKRGTKPPARRAPAKRLAPPPVDAAAAHKRMDEALQAFYKTYLITKEHYPAYFEVLRFEGKLPEHKLTISKAWEKVPGVVAKGPRQAKATLYLMLFHRAKRQGKPEKALAWLKKAKRFGSNPKLMRKLLPEAYLATHNYTKVWLYLKAKMKTPLGKKPNFEPVTSTLLLDILFRMDKLDSARSWGRRLTKQCKPCKKHSDFWYWRGRIEEGQRGVAKARVLYFRAHQLSPKAVAPLAGLSRLAVRAQQKRAAASIKRVEQMVPTRLIDQISLMELWLEAKRYKALLAISTKTLKVHPLDAWVRRLAGLASLEVNKLAEAKVHFEKALQVRSSDLAATQGLAMILDKQGKYDEALKLYEKVLEEKTQNAQLWYRSGRLYFIRKAHKKAIRSIKKALELNDKLALAHFTLAKALKASKQKNVGEKIKESLERAVELEPKNRVYLYQLAKYYYKNRANRKALNIYTKLLRAPNQTKAQKAEVYFERGKLLFQEQGWSKALRDFRTLAKMLPNDARGPMWIADIFREQRRKGQAIRWYKKTLKLMRKTRPSKDDPADALRWQEYKVQMGRIYGNLGDFYRDSRSFAAAIGYYHRALRFNPKSYMYHRQLGYLYKEKRRWGQCRRHLRTYLRLGRKYKQRLIDRQEVENDIRGCR